MSFFTTLQVSGSALRAERLRLDLAAANLANANATRSAEGGPYRRRDPVLAAVGLSGPNGRFGGELMRAIRQVRVVGIRLDPRPPREVFDPRHPDADENGIVLLPNVKVLEESVNMMNAARAFEANVAAITASRDMAQRALRIGKGG